MDIILGGVLILAIIGVVILYWRSQRFIGCELEIFRDVTLSVVKENEKLKEDVLELTGRADKIDEMLKDFDVEENMDKAERIDKAFTDGIMNILNHGFSRGKKDE